MGFDTQKFQGINFKDRVAEIEIQDLAEFFDKKEKPIWRVRGLRGEELAVARESEETARNLNAIIEGITAKSAKGKAKAIMQELGLSDDKAPGDYVRRLELLRLGSVDPAIDKPIAVKLANNYPTAFYQLTNKILELTGLGRLGESKGSGTTRK